MSYQQLCGAIGALSAANVELPYADIYRQLRGLAGEHGADTFATNTASQPLARAYRDMCVQRGLVQRGYLFNEDDAAALSQRFSDMQRAGEL